MARTAKPKTLSDELRAALLRDKRNLAEIARACGLDKSQLSRFARGERDLLLTTATPLARELGLWLRRS
ncbi:MAG: helix-turn-helix transcriptional regulator [Planctomycetes bacterium]|nr:helix-turn-helix transcriptional regulator [Planctomycetota bacterium]